MILQFTHLSTKPRTSNDSIIPRILLYPLTTQDVMFIHQLNPTTIREHSDDRGVTKEYRGL